MNEEKMINEQELEKATGGIFGGPGGPDLASMNGLAHYRCPDCGRELVRSKILTETPVCPECGKEMLRV